MTIEDTARLMIRHSLTARQTLILFACHREAQMMTELARICCVTSASMTGQSDELTSRGLIRREYGNDKDRRKVWITLTDAGREKVRQMRAEAEEVDFSPNPVQ